MTGGTGFIGSNLVKALDAEGHELRLLSRKPIADYENFICNFEEDVIPEDAFKNIDVVYHLAGIAHDTRDALKIEFLYRKINVDTSIQLVKLAAKNGVRKFIFVSSVKAGGAPPNGKCYNENSGVGPEDIYGLTKKEAEQSILEIGKSAGMHVSIIRPSLVYGPNVKGNLELLLDGIHKGWFPPLPKINNFRTMIHIDDLINAILLVTDHVDANDEIYIVTDGVQYSSRAIYEAICLATGRSIPGWNVPIVFFKLFAKLGDFFGRFVRFPFNSYGYGKLFGDDCYVSDKIRSQLGYNSKMTLVDALPEMISVVEK